MTATVTLAKTPNTGTWEGEGFIVKFYDDSFSAVVMNAGDERLLRGDEFGVYGDNDYYVIYFENGIPVLELIAYDEIAADYEE